jgi:hypothetical protein
MKLCENVAHISSGLILIEAKFKSAGRTVRRVAAHGISLVSNRIDWEQVSASSSCPS